MARGEDWDQLARALAQWLEAEGVVNWESAVGGNVFTERALPATPDTAVGIRSTGGFESGIGADEESLPTIQVLARAKAQQEAINLLGKVYAKLHGARYVQLPEGLFLLYAIGQNSNPVLVEQDSAGRYVYSTNYRLATG